MPKVRSLIHRLRHRCTQLVREEVERTVLDPAEVEAELRKRRAETVLQKYFLENDRSSFIRSFSSWCIQFSVVGQFASTLGSARVSRA